jgi:hypothetical protein
MDRMKARTMSTALVRAAVVTVVLGPWGCADLLGADFDGWLPEEPDRADAGMPAEGGADAADAGGVASDGSDGKSDGTEPPASAVQLLGSFVPAASGRGSDGVTLEGSFVWHSVSGTTAENIELRGLLQ